MKIFLASDHRGFEQKNQVLEWLKENQYQVDDLGNDHYDPNDDYPDFVGPAAKSVAAQSDTRAIIFCGSGAGANIAANKVKGVRASLAWTIEQVMAARHDDDINVLVIATDFLASEVILGLVEKFLTTTFAASEERYVRRLNKIAALEQG